VDADFSDSGSLVGLSVQLLLVVSGLRAWCGGDWVGTQLVGVMGFVGTLLGPETTSSASVCAVGSVWMGVGVGVSALPRSRVYRSILRGGCLVLVCGRGVGLLFENCTVDASIFVAKFLRAHGGCLGIRSR
jgi:hypothetical protein